MFLAVVLFTLFGVDVTANQAGVTREVWKSMEGAGRSTIRVVEATVAFMVGGG